MHGKNDTVSRVAVEVGDGPGVVVGSGVDYALREGDYSCSLITATFDASYAAITSGVHNAAATACSSAQSSLTSSPGVRTWR